MKNKPASPAALIARIKSLRHRHKAISDKISTEETRPMPDATLIKTLKKQRLLVKDAIFYTGTILTRAGIRSHG